MSRGADRGAEEANSVGVNQGQLQEAIGELLFVTASESALRRDSLQRLLPPHLLLIRTLQVQPPLGDTTW